LYIIKIVELLAGYLLKPPPLFACIILANVISFFKLPLFLLKKFLLLRTSSVVVELLFLLLRQFLLLLRN
jgi:hypothetical protein